jgi:hypothetical protein
MVGGSASPFCYNTPSSSLTRKRPNSYKRLLALDIAVFRISSEYIQARLSSIRITVINVPVSCPTILQVSADGSGALTRRRSDLLAGTGLRASVCEVSGEPTGSELGRNIGVLEFKSLLPISSGFGFSVGSPMAQSSRPDWNLASTQPVVA